MTSLIGQENQNKKKRAELEVNNTQLMTGQSTMTSMGGQDEGILHQKMV